MVLRAPIKEVGVGQVRTSDVAHSLPHRDELAGVRVGQRPQQNTVDHTEHCSVRADTKRQSYDGYGRETWTAAKLAQTISDVLPEARQKVRHPPRSGWLAEWDRLKGGHPLV